jgi:dihydrofolate reductase
MKACQPKHKVSLQRARFHRVLADASHRKYQHIKVQLLTTADHPSQQGTGMRRLQLFIATSIDGFIACPDGSIAWLFSDADYGYEAFFDQTDTVLMGRKTFHQVLEMGEWPYPGRQAYVFSHSVAPEDAPQGVPDLHVTSEAPSKVVNGLKSTPGKNIWLVGGASITGELLQSGLVDDLIISVHPIILGAGVPLASQYSQSGPLFEYWDLVSTVAFPSGLVQLSYKQRLPARGAAMTAQSREQLPKQEEAAPTPPPLAVSDEQLTKASGQAAVASGSAS